ncbi:NDMA-dependent alcohol dehydrogenase [Mycobacterium avium]|uniref:alcohol dehydrogenase n=1 Tax=Mycobacterium avium TaxID=1764 RepID=A0A2A2ZNF2_MYCAV|nr:NDMA-dependent alcohol dehydrogenase [Mycobacterium avium]ETZ44707.1 NDMA-dependent alcohol dehydrogenase, Rxyl_3153 family protein [Mycobacterium avium MAV_120709_2344]MCA4735814.1 NDMA-dependent alcohol dehydrogenase [Mycobacterium avium subsp. hominissuis]MCA4740463.1 NDMA-dependent alcohol dehydrogenase [Mycobacterium avium subsp. hominissuis]MCA4744705.1 NDMA-dependent alcohol dehydrogenase [Mycobacterium avium subsp. hominissuis]MCA4764284.1 NDMA-dependent alcohol dehydrogenase [Mycob
MKTTAAIIVEPGKPFEIEELHLDGPADNEVLIRYTYAGLCHSDLHVLNGDFPARLPMVGGHEGAGVIEDIGPGVTRVRPGDHVVCSFIPSCGVCRWCASGQQAICDWGATILEGYLPPNRFPRTGARGDYGALCMLGTFSQYGTIHQNSVVKVDPHLPLDKAVLVGCGVTTGWASAVYAADVEPGDTVLIIGIGGIGANALQGAQHAGARNVIAVDPLEYKRSRAAEFGATHSVATLDEAVALCEQLTHGVGADAAIITTGTVEEHQVTAAFNAIRKGGTVVITGMGKLDDLTVRLSSTMMALYKKTVKGTLFGDANPTADIPKLLTLYLNGRLKLDELITRRYSLEDVNTGYDDLQAGINIRGIIDLAL